MNVSDTNDRAKLIERARKLFAMSQDAGSPEEAAIAARRVRSLMDKHDITPGEIEAARPDDFGVEEMNHAYKAVPLWYSTLGIAVARYCDCQYSTQWVKYGEGVHNYGKRRGIFKGFKADSIVATMTFDYLLQAMERQLKTARKDVDKPYQRRFGGSFRTGFALEMQGRLGEMTAEREREQIAATPGTALVLAKRDAVAGKFGEARYQNRAVTVSSQTGYGAGRTAAQRTSLSKQVSGSQRAALA